MVEIQLRVEGVSEVLKSLNRLGREISEAVVPATLQAAQVLQTAIQQRAPVRTGRLRDSILVEITEQTPNRVEVEVGPTVPYADDVEFGTSRSPAQPYLRPAIDENLQAVTDALAKSLQQILDEL
jgi:HK97 gp10 family phage protein